MDRNVFVAIALSMSVLLFWGAFFETPKKTSDHQINQKVEQKREQNSIAPTIDQPKIINGASDIIAKIFEKKGEHTRAAVSVNSLPLGVAVEVDAIFELN